MMSNHTLPWRRYAPFGALALLALACAPSIEDTPGGTDSHEPPMITDVDVVANPNNTLSAFVRWTTDIPASSVVEFGRGSDLESWIGDEDSLTVDHEVLVIGMQSERTYRLDPISVSEGGAEARGESAFFQTGTLPFEAFAPRLSQAASAATQPGWTVANIVTRGILSPVFVVMFDQEGEPVWYWANDGDGGRADVDASLVYDTDSGDPRVLIGAGVAPHGPMEIDLAGDISWEGPVQAGTELLAEGEMHHAFDKLDNGNYVTLLYDYDGGLHDVIEEFDTDGNRVWSWDAREHLDHSGGYKWGNAVKIDLANDAVYYNSEHESQLHKIRRSTGEPLWTLGESGDFVNEQREEDAWFISAHGAEVLANEHILMYDNGDGDRGYSRAIEYAIDEDGGDAYIVWEYPRAGSEDDVWFNGVWGDADRLDNGNTLITAGSTLANSSPCRLFEVDVDGNKVWELWLESDDPEQTFGAYASDRIPAFAHPL
jgi:hypothetical protein